MARVRDRVRLKDKSRLRIWVQSDFGFSFIVRICVGCSVRVPGLCG